jgi:hypothetical protein
MALYSLDIEKVLAGEYWTNRYILNSASPPDPFTGPVNAILAAERSITADEVQFTKLRVSDNDPGTDVYSIRALNLPGLRTGVFTDLFPLFVTVRVDFTVGTGRPSRKYLRGVLKEGDSVFNAIQQPALDLFQTSYANAVAGVPEYVDVDGQDILSGAVILAPAMRQLRRGSKRKLAPII